MQHGLSLLANYTWSKSYDDLPQATRVSNTEDLNAGASYVYPQARTAVWAIARLENRASTG